MKKTHRWLSAFVSVALAFAVAGCHIDSDIHEHSFSKDWTSDATDHWHAATCEHTKEVSGKATHTFGEWKTTVEATEETEGKKERSCSVCSYKEEQSLAKLDHTHKFSSDWTSDATDHWHAATCGHTKQVSDKTAHTFGEWKITVEATEETEGKKERSCSVCLYKEEQSLAKLDHTHKFSTDWTSDATDHWHNCSGCEEVSGKTAHIFGEWTVTKTATCTEKGSRKRTCSVCKYEATEDISAKGHAYSEDWTSDAIDHWHTATCEHAEEVSGKTAHTFGEWKTTVEATEETEGKKERICSVCSYKEEQSLAKLDHTHKFSSDWTSNATDHWHAATCEHTEEVSGKTAHTFGEWKTTVEATEETEGKKERICSVCSYKDEQSLAKLDHTHKFSSDWTSNATDHWHAATCEHATEVSGKTAHTFGEWTVTKAATCTEKGSRKHTCSVCKYEATEDISAKGHAYSEDWTSDATDHWHAATCEHTEEVSGKTAHTFGEWETTVEATEKTEGKKERICSVCSYKEEQSIAKVPVGFVKVKGGTVTGKSNTNNYPGVFIKGRTVTLSDFYMSKYEVTKAQYKAIMEDTSLNTLKITADPSYSTLKPKTYVMAAGEEDYERPVENVTWYDAVYFCNLLSQKEGLEPVYTINNPQTSTASISSAGASGTETVSIKYISSATVTADHTKNGYRLPTEAEWEFAARGGDTTKDDWNYVFSGADTADGVSYDSFRNAGLDSVGWYGYNSINGTTGDTSPSRGKQGYGTHQVGKKAPNRLGLYDMSGNVWERCYDWSGTITTTTPADGATSGSDRVYRGGCWNRDADNASVSFRNGKFYPGYRSDYLGFRVVRSSSK